MNWVKFMKTDFLFYKYQKVVMLAFPVFVILMSIYYSKDMIFIISYLCFGVLIVSTTPYCLENKNMSTFIQMLPGSDRERVVGRFMCFGAMLMAAVAYGIGVVAGAFVGWTVAYMRLRWVEKNLDTHVFCRGVLVKQGNGPEPSGMVDGKAGK